MIQGLQKLTLLDYPGKVACTVFTAGCNFRCPFCHNASLVTHIQDGREITQEEVFAFLKKRRGILDGVCVTGGEPLLHKDIEELLREIKELGFSVKLDTNGSFPDRLKGLVEEGLVDYIAMDIKNAKENYGRTIGIEDYDVSDVARSVHYLLEGNVPYELRTTVVREFHQRADLEAIRRWIEGAEHYYLQQFVDSGDLIQPGLRGYDRDIMEQALGTVKKYVKAAELRGL